MDTAPSMISLPPRGSGPWRLALDATVEKVEDYPTILGYGVMSTPGLVVDDKVLVSGRVPKPAEIKQLLTTAMAG